MVRQETGCELVRDMVVSKSARKAILEQVSRRGLRDCWIAGGFVRNAVWDTLFTGDGVHRDGDVDVLYFDRSWTLAEIDAHLSDELSRATGFDVEVKNQARMHTKNNDPPYKSTYEALSRWTETCTSIAIRLGDTELEVVAPHGVEDLITGYIRPTSNQEWVLDLVAKRVESKDWLRRWHGLTLDPRLHGRLSNYLTSLDAS